MELATVKKGTPLYGQPSWWGEDEEADESITGHVKAENEKKESSSDTKRSRPNSLTLSGNEEVVKCPLGVDMMEHSRRSNVNFMDIPLKDEEDVETPGRGDKSKDNMTLVQSTDSTLSNDSLLSSPDLKADKLVKESSPVVEKNPGMSFTIDLGDEKPRKLNMNASLSEFVPPKMRKNFKERKGRVSSSKTGSKESTPTKQAEEQDLSPSHQRKIEDIWSSVESKGSKGSRLSSVHATLGSSSLSSLSSLRSPNLSNLEDIDRLSELSEERKSVEKDFEKKGKRPVLSKSPQMTKSVRGKVIPSSNTTGTSSASPGVSKKSTSKHLSPVSHSLYSDPTSYLIDKMFEGGHSSSTSSSKETSPEIKLYREAAVHDRTKSAFSKATTNPAHSEVKPVQSRISKQSSNNLDKVQESKKKGDNNDEGDDLRIVEDDKASEAGTYTIEADELDEDFEEEARQRIDQVFGVDVDSFVDRPIIDPQRMDSPGGYDNVKDSEHLDGDKTPLDETNDYYMFSDKRNLHKDGDDLILGDEDSPGSPGMATTDGVQTWVSQLTALTSQKAANMATDVGKINRDEENTSNSKKPPHGISRKRPGTGRRLPSIPTDRSPESSEHSSFVGDPDLHINDDLSSPSRSLDLMINGKTSIPAPTNGGSKPSRISSQPVHRSTSNGHVGDGLSPVGTSRSRGSVDTELLLQDTKTVMAAMEARMANHKFGNRRSYSPGQESDTDASSTVALANGSDNHSKPILYRSPRDALSKRQTKVAAVKSTNGTPSTPPGLNITPKKTLGRTYSQTVASKSKTTASPRSIATSLSTAKKSVVSDVFSRVESIDNDSIVSDVSSDIGDANLSRTGSKGKGGISMAKPNRAFQLRRARADSVDEPTTPRSAKSTARSSSISGRSASVHSSTRRSVLDTQRSEGTSLGGQIVRKSKQNSEQEKARSSSNLSREDGGRHSLRLQRATSLTLSQAATKASASKRESTPKIALKPSIVNSRGPLSVTGVGSNSSRSQSQPGSRSNSPKAAERMAWQRRKQYDPRKAVADAKAKSKDSGSTSSINTYGVKPRPKPSAISTYNRRMIRSASFTNSQELQLSVQNALSTSQDHVAGGDRREPEQEGFRRAFIPFHSSLRTDRSAFSADEDESLLSAGSTQVSYDTLIVSSIYQLSLKLKTATDKTMNKLRDEDRLSLTPSPIDDYLNDSGKSEITAWKSANQELAGILKNLRRIERHVSVMDRALFQESDNETDRSSTGLRVGQNYVQEIERIRNEIKGFQPIEPHDHEVISPDMEELSEQF